MSPWNTLPWNTIFAIIGVSMLIPVILTFIFLRVKRYEDLGMAIGVFLLILGSVSYVYLIPQDIIHETKLPEDYIWEDQGTVHYWERNGLFLRGIDQRRIPFAIRWILPERTPIIRDFVAKEVIHVSDFDKQESKALIHDVIYDNTGSVLTVINNTQKISEWYWIDSHTKSLEYLGVDAGRMGIPTMSKGINTIQMGWVESDGEQSGKENVVLVREMQRIQSGFINGVEVDVWRSDIYNKQIFWHGEFYYCDETLQLTVNPTSGYVVHVYRHLVLSAHLSQFLKLYYPSAMNSRIVSNYLKVNDPIGEAAELTYNTTADSMNTHLAMVQDINNLIVYVPLWVCIPILSVGLALTWRYFGRSYYWKRYKQYEQIGSLSQRRTKRKPRRKVLAIALCSILLVSPLGYIFINQNRDNHEEDMHIPAFTGDAPPISPEEDEPTPPGTNRIIDSGRHVLELTDEGFHKGSRREWWYFNVFFNDPDSDLQGYSLIVSFNQMKFFDVRFLRPDNLFILMFDDKSTSYSFSTFNKRRGTLQASNSGVDVTFENSWIKGSYPSWHVHAVNDEKGFVTDLDVTADFLPVWVEGRSANLPFASLVTGGDYYVPRCKVTGNITWDGKQYHVGGMGYHDHVWQSVVPRWVSPGWDWANLHFDNGWEMYVSKFNLRAPFKLSFDSIIISPNNRNITEFNSFDITYIETATPKGLPFMKYPKKMHIDAERDGVILQLDITVANTAENVWRIARTGMFEGPCVATGTLSWSGHTVELNGYGLSEFTRVKYLLSFLNIFRQQ
jgi:predicted secreted hydrolase